jgi:ABC-type transport system substrate-binding protein
VWGTSDAFAPLDPFGPAGDAFDVSRLVFRGLGQPHPLTGAPVPDLAESWAPAPGGRAAALRVQLPAGLRFHDGVAVTAADVVSSYERALAPGSEWRDLLARLEVRVSAPAERSVLIEATALPADVLAVPLVRRADATVGAGPFAVAERRPGARLVLRAHAHHLPAAPRLDRVTVLALSPAELLARLEAGALDGATLPSDPATAQRLAADGRWTVVPLPAAGRLAVLDVQSRALRERAAWHSDRAWNAHLWYVCD